MPQEAWLYSLAHIGLLPYTWFVWLDEWSFHSTFIIECFFDLIDAKLLIMSLGQSDISLPTPLKSQDIMIKSAKLERFGWPHCLQLWRKAASFYHSCLKPRSMGGSPSCITLEWDASGPLLFLASKQDYDEFWMLRSFNCSDLKLLTEFWVERGVYLYQLQTAQHSASLEDPHIIQPGRWSQSQTASTASQHCSASSSPSRGKLPDLLPWHILLSFL